MSFQPFVIESQDGTHWKFALDNRALRQFDPKDGFGMPFSYLYAASATYRHDCGLDISYEDFTDKVLPTSPAVMARAGEVKAELESFFSAFVQGQTAAKPHKS